MRRLQRSLVTVAWLWVLLLGPAAVGRGQAVVERTAEEILERAAPAEAPLDTEDAAKTAGAVKASDVERSSIPATDIERIIAAGRDNNQVMAHLDYLVNRIGPRLSGSDNLTNASEWARDKFESLGLVNAHLEKWDEWPVGFNRGPWFGRIVSPEPRVLEFGTDAWTAGTRGKQRGPAMLAPTNSTELAAAKGKLSGKWLLAGATGGGRQGGRGARRGGQADDRPDGQSAASAGTDPPVAAQPAAGQRGGEPSTSGDGKETAERSAAAEPQQPENQAVAPGQPDGERGRGGRRGGGNRGAGRRGFNDPFRQELQTAARDEGALGVISRRDAELIVVTGRRPTSAEFFDNIPTLPQITMTASSYDAVAELLRAGKEVELEFDIRNYFKRGPIPLYNVVADLPGSEIPDEYVIVCGHLDSWDAGTGTTDNGTGVSTAIEAARILTAAGVRPKRTIRFILWTGEEQGLLGSRAYVEKHADLMPKISAVLNHDVGTQYISSIRTLPYQRSDLEYVFAPVMSLNEAFPFRLQPTDSLGGSGGSDHASFNRVGVPGFIWGQSGDLARYSDTHHTQIDTYDRAVPAYQEHSSLVVALAAYGIANLDHMLPRADGEGGE